MENILTSEKITRFIKHLQCGEKAQNTIEKYHRDSIRFMQFLSGLPVTKESVIQYKKYLLDENYSVRSVNSMLASVNALLSFLGWEQCRVRGLKVQRMVYCPEEKELTKEEFKRLVRTAQRQNNHRLSLLLETIGATGIRISELPFITVEAAKAGAATVSLKGKTRQVFLVKELKKKLLCYAAKQNIKSGMIFVTKSGRAISRTNVWREMKALCGQANVAPQKVFPHNLRHLFARLFYKIQRDIAKLADVLGHSSIETTRIYIVSSGAEHRKCMEQMHLIL